MSERRKSASSARHHAAPAIALAAGSTPDYRALVEAAGDIIYTLDLQGCFTFINPAMIRVLGYSLDEALGRSFAQFLTPATAQVALRHFRLGLAENESTPFFEVEARRKSGGTVHLEIRAGGLFREGRMIGRQGIARDISELKSLQTAVAEKSERVALLEERTRIALDLYARIADLAGSDTGPAQSHDVLLQVHEAVLRVSADKMGLKATDLKVLELLSQGRSNREIAVAVNRSPHTVKDQVTKIMQRLGARRRAEAVATALGAGLIGRGP